MKFIKIPYPDGEFEIGETPVTQIQWKKVMGTNPSRFRGSSLPVETVSWNDCQEFCKIMNSLDGINQKYIYRLPTEKEWEFACGPDPKNVMDYGWFYENSGSEIHPVKKKKPNKFGLYDMLGNVWEWCEDLYAYNCGSGRVIRGGSWNYGARNLRSAYRLNATPGVRYGNLGFRLTRTKVTLGAVTLSPSSPSETREAKVEAVIKDISSLIQLIESDLFAAEQGFLSRIKDAKKELCFALKKLEELK